MDNERRQHERVRFGADVELQAGEEIVLLHLDNISEGGALMTCSGCGHMQLSRGERIEAFIDLGSDYVGENLSLCLEGEVVRLEQRGPDSRAVGMRWLPMSDEKLEQLARLMRHLRTRADAA
jgi:hypothetical protein